MAGPSVPDELLWSASALDESRYLAGISDAVANGVLCTEPGRYVFRHSLTREAVIGQLLPFELRQLHGLVAAGLEKTEPCVDIVTQAVIAAHWYVSGDHERTRSASKKAAEQAFEVNAFAESWHHYQRVLELLDRSKDKDQVALLVAAAEAARWAGNITSGVALLRQVLAETDDPAEQATLHERLGSYLWEAGSHESHQEYSLAARLLADLPGSPTEASVLAGQARVSALTAHYRQALDEGRRAVESARRWRLTAVEAGALNSLALAEAGLGHDAAAVAHLLEALHLAKMDDDFEATCRTYANLVWVSECIGNHVQSASVALEGLKHLEQRGLQLGIGSTLANNAAAILLLRGRHAEAEDILQNLLAGWSPQGQSLQLFLTLAHLQVRLGRLAVARESLYNATSLRSADDPHRLVGFTTVETELLLAEGRLDEAHNAVFAALRGIGDIEDDSMRAELGRLGLWVEADRLATSSKRSSREVLDAVTWLADHLPVAPPGEGASSAGGIVTAATLLTARLEASRANGSDDWQSWHDAAEMWRAVDRPWDVAYCLWREAQKTAEGRQVGQTRTVLEELWAIATRIQAQPLLDAATALARSARLPPLTGGARPSIAVAAPFDLSPKELEVWQMLPDGATNREIATKLFMSERTAAVHVSHILKKLGVDNRVRAATLAHEFLSTMNVPLPGAGT